MNNKELDNKINEIEKNIEDLKNISKDLGFDDEKLIEELRGEKENRRNTMKVYTNNGCRNCKMLKRWLDNKEISYEEVNIGEDPSARAKLIGMGRRNLPQVEVDGEFIDFKEYNELLKYKGE